MYEQNKTQIDQYLDLINSKITELTDKYVSDAILIIHLFIYIVFHLPYRVPFLKKPVPVEKKDE